MMIFIIIDALGWERLKRIEFLDDIMPYRRPLKTVFGYSSGAIPSILTGKFPCEHGHWNFFYLSPQTSPFAWIKDKGLIDNRLVFENRYTREIMRRMSRYMSGYTGTFSFPLIPFDGTNVSPGGYFSNFDICEKKWLFNPGSLDSTENIFDVLTREAVSFNRYTYGTMSDSAIVERALIDMQKSNSDFYFIYFSEFDECQHLHCGDEDVISRKLQWYEDSIRKLYYASKDRDSNSTMIICSDHGMAEVIDHVDIMSHLNDLNINLAEDYLAVYDSTMVRFWCFNDNAREVITSLLLKLDCGSILTDNELKDMGVFEDRRYGEIIFLLDEGKIVYPGMMGNWRPRGMHGYHPDCPSSYAVFLSEREPEAEPECITDIHGIVKRVMSTMFSSRGGAMS